MCGVASTTARNRNSTLHPSIHVHHLFRCPPLPPRYAQVMLSLLDMADTLSKRDTEVERLRTLVNAKDVLLAKERENLREVRACYVFRACVLH